MPTDPASPHAPALPEGAPAILPDVFASDRRRSPRTEPPPVSQAELSTVIEMQVVDLSETGVLLACDRTIVPGQRARIQMVLAHNPFLAWIEVTRISQVDDESSSGPQRCLVAAAFTSMDDRSAQALRHFLPRKTTLLLR